MTLTRSQLDELKRLDKRAAEGPWFADDFDTSGLTVIDDGREDGLFPIKAETSEAALIIAMRNALPALIEAAEENERLRGNYATSLATANRDIEELIRERDQARKEAEDLDLALELIQEVADQCVFEDWPKGFEFIARIRGES